MLITLLWANLTEHAAASHQLQDGWTYERYTFCSNRTTSPWTTSPDKDFPIAQNWVSTCNGTKTYCTWRRLPVQLRLNIDLLYLASPPPSFTLVSKKTHDTFQRTIYVKQDWLMWVSAFIATWDKKLFIYMYNTSTRALLINKQSTANAMRREENCLQESHISLWVTKNSL
jgi:hypothetical protein